MQVRGEKDPTAPCHHFEDEHAIWKPLTQYTLKWKKKHPRESQFIFGLLEQCLFVPYGPDIHALADALHVGAPKPRITLRLPDASA